MAIVAKKLVEWNPGEPGHFVDLAYATRRTESIDVAHAILKRAEGLHPNDAKILFNLACYESTDYAMKWPEFLKPYSAGNDALSFRQ